MCMTMSITRRRSMPAGRSMSIGPSVCCPYSSRPYGCFRVSVNSACLPGYGGFFQFLRNFRQLNAFEQAELVLQAALEPTIASRAKKGEFVTCFDHFDLLQTAIN